MDESEVRTSGAPATGPDAAEAQVQARVAWYYYVGGMTQQEIADRLGISQMQVSRRLSKLLAGLRTAAAA